MISVQGRLAIFKFSLIRNIKVYLIENSKAIIFSLLHFMLIDKFKIKIQ